MDDAAVFGINLPAETPTKPASFEVWEENWPAVQLFLKVQTQWRVGMNGPIGLDYGAVQWIIRLYKTPNPRAVLEDLQIMEAAVLAVVGDGAG